MDAARPPAAGARCRDGPGCHRPPQPPGRAAARPRRRAAGHRGDDLTAWLAAQPELAVGVALDDPRPRRGSLLGFAVAGADGRVVAADASDAPRLVEAVLGSGRPLVGHEVKPMLVWELSRRDPDGAHQPQPRGRLAATGRVRHPDRGLHPQRSAPQPVPRRHQLRSAWGSSCRARASCGVPHMPRSRPWPSAASREALTTRAGRRARPAPGPGRAGAAADPGPRGPRGDGRRRSTRRPSASSTGPSPGRSAGWRRRSSNRSATGSRSAARSSSSRCCSTSSTCRAAGGPRPASRPTRRCWRTSGPPIRWCGMLLDWRLYTKLKSTYVDALPALLESGHGSPPHHVPPGGRRDRPAVVDRSEPPEHPDPDRAWPPDPARVRGGRRATACCWPPTTARSSSGSWPTCRGDVHLREAFERRADIHRETAARVLKKAPEAITADERSMAKMVNFGLAYGMSDFGLSSRAGIPRQEAQDFISSYFAAYSGISYYMMHIKDTARQRGYVETLLGRRRWIPELEARNSRAARRRRADGDQHAHPGHRGGHHEDGHDPAPRPAAERAFAGPDAAVGARRGAAGGAAGRGRATGGAWCARPWRACSTWTCRWTWTSRSATTGSRCR